MMKVLIVDDEALVRVGLKSMIPWEELGFEIVGEAANGQIGVNLIGETKPDIVLTDIKMPLLDGLEMMRRVVQPDYKPKFIILSSYDEFQLVKQAMKLGAEEYLIKLDLEPDILTETLMAARGKILAERGTNQVDELLKKGLRENIAMLREGFFKRMINRAADPREADEQVAGLGIELNPSYLACATIRIRQLTALDKYDAQELRLWEDSFLNTIHEIVNDVFTGYAFAWNQGEFVVVFSGGTDFQRDSYRDKASAMAERLIRVLKQYFNIAVSIGLSELHQGYHRLAQAYLESCRAVQYSIYSGAEKSTFFGEVPKSGGTERIDLMKLRDSIPRAIELHDLEALRIIFGNLVGMLEDRMTSRGQAYDLCFQIAFIISGVTGLNEAALQEILGYNHSLYENILTLNTLPEIIHWIHSLEQNLGRYLAKNEEQRNHRQMAKVKKYIMEHCAAEISLPEAAAIFGLSPSYLSTIFKQYTGTCFSDYVAEMRIEQAKKLLRDSDYKIYQISNLLGYQNAYYFSRVFKKITGMTPSEFSGRNIE